MNMDEKLQEVCRAFRIEEEYVGYEAIQVGIVNRTYKVNFRLADGSPKSFLVQNVNTYAFRNPVGLMNNWSPSISALNARRSSAYIFTTLRIGRPIWRTEKTSGA